MSVNIVRVSSNYKITAQGGTITLDTGGVSGNVVINGSLSVTGTTTTVNTVQMTVEDSVITLNNGELGTNGVTGVTPFVQQAGLDIYRGASPEDGNGNAQMLWDETISWIDSNTGTTKYGSFVFKTVNGGLNSIHTTSVVSSNNITLQVGSSSVIAVRGASNYAANVTDANHIPNKAYVDSKLASVTNSVVAAPSDSKGSSGDTAGSIAFDSYNFYYCTTSYTTGSDDIWVKVPWITGTWP
jgi:hypothetical protein